MAAIIARDGARGRSYQVKERGKPGKTFKRKSDALLYKAQLEAGVVAEQSRRSTSTVRELEERRRASRRASRSTLAKEHSLAKRFGPLADRKVDDMRVSDVRAWVADLVDEGLAPETVAACLRLLRSVLDTAVDDDEVAANVAARVKPPRIVKPPLDADDVLTVAELEAVLERIPDR